MENTSTLPANVRFRLDPESGFVWDDSAEEWLTSAELVFEAMESALPRAQASPSDNAEMALIQIASLASEFELSRLSTPSDHRRRWRKLGEIAHNALKARHA